MKKISAFAMSIYLCLPSNSYSQVEKYSITPPVVNPIRPIHLFIPTPEFTLQLYQLMKDVHDLLTQHNIQYWADGGTLIGAIRHKGIISWDFDLDIDIHIKDKEQFDKLIPLLKKLTYEIEIPYWSGYKIYANKFRELSKPSLDIFFWQDENDEYSFDSASSTLWGKRNGKPIYLTRDELFPLKEYQFGEIKIFAANNPIPYLNNMYGEQWQNVGLGSNLMSRKRETWILTDEDRKPATPTGPLKQNVPKKTL